MQEGEVLFLPSYWWHDVRSMPPDAHLESSAATSVARATPAPNSTSHPGASGHLPPELDGSGTGAAAVEDEVTELTGDGTACGMTASINYFFTPYYRKANDLRHFSHEAFYSFLRGGRAGGSVERGAADPNRWRRRREDTKSEL